MRIPDPIQTFGLPDNPLVRVMVLAHVNRLLYRRWVAEGLSPAEEGMEGWGPLLSSPDEGYLEQPCKTIELAGILGMYRWLSLDMDVDYEFGNDLSQIVHGIDAVLKDRKTGHYILCESKGTTRKISSSPLTYLRPRQKQERQLSQRWCWSSLMRFLRASQASWVLPKLMKPFLMGETKRMLIVSEVVQCRDGFRPSGESRAWFESDLAAVPDLNKPLDKKWRTWWNTWETVESERKNLQECLGEIANLIFNSLR